MESLLLAGIFVVWGHNWPVFLNFKGGKGSASSFGFIMFLDYKIAMDDDRVEKLYIEQLETQSMSSDVNFFNVQ